MAVPEIKDLLIPLLETIKDKDEYKIKEVTDDVIELIEVSDEDKQMKLPNGETVLESRISTANTYLKKAELIESNRFLYYNITDEGLNVLKENPDGIDEEDLMKYPGFRELKSVFTHDDSNEIESPQDALKESLSKYMEDVRKEITDDVLKENKVKFFIPKDQKESKDIYEIKSRRDELKKDKEEKRKCHNRHKHHHGHHHKHKYFVYKDFSPADELLKYAELVERGYLTRDEFNKKKEELLKL